MRILAMNYKDFSLQFQTPFINSNTVFTQRRGFIVSLTDNLGNIGLGECSPLAGFSIETYSEAEKNLKDIKERICSLEFFDNIKDISYKLLTIGMLPSVRFAIEQAILNLNCKRDINFLKNNFSLSNKLINVNAVIGFGNLEDLLDKIKSKIDLGYSVFKIKVGRDNPYEDFELLESIRTIFGYDIKLRLDANRKWSSDEAIEYIDRFKDYDIEYIEEPCEYACSISKTIEFSQIPIALDESVSTLENAKSAIAEIKAQYFVIKPMVLGSIFESIDLIKEAEKQNRIVIISSSFESPLAKSALVFLAAHTNHNFAHGLDTANLFNEDIFDDEYKVSNGSINFTSNSFPPNYSIQIND